MAFVISVLTTSYYQDHTQLEKTTLNLLNEAKGPFMILETPSSTSYPKAYYSYAPIYFNISTPSCVKEESFPLLSLARSYTDWGFNV